MSSPEFAQAVSEELRTLPMFPLRRAIEAVNAAEQVDGVRATLLAPNPGDPVHFVEVQFGSPAASAEYLQTLANMN